MFAIAAAAAYERTRMDDPHLVRVIADLDRLEPRLREVTMGLDGAALHLQPPAGGWTIAQIFEHMRIADSSYVDGCLPKAIAKAQGKAKKPWKPSLFGGWLRRALANFQKPLPAPKIYRVAGVPRGDVVEAWLAGVRKLRALIESADRLDLNTRLSSPVSKLIRISLGDALAIPVVHSHRHLGQVERTRKALGR